MSQLSNIRYGYFDALRGFSMILVVYHHVMIFSIGNARGIDSFFYSFRMPLFFFISGFFAFKSLERWNKSLIKDIIKRKFKVQIIGASMFLSIYTIFMLNRFPNIHDFLDPDKYWFTFILFRIFILYILIVIIAKFFRQREKVFWTLLLSMAIICYGIFVYYNEVIQSLRWSTLSEIFLYQLFYKWSLYYLPYFALGIFARAKLGLFERIATNNLTIAFVILMTIIIWCLVSLDFPIPLRYPYLHFSYPFRVLSMVLVIQFFYKIKNEFDRDTQFSKAIRLIGRRTLDIYFIHYFFLPNLHFLKPFCESNDSVLFQLIFGGSVSLIIVGLSLLIGNVIRISPMLAEWLLGVKKDNRLY